MVHHRFFPVFIGCRLLDCNDLAGNPCKFFRVLELLPIFLHQVRGKVCKIFLAKTNDQKIPGHNIIDAVSYTHLDVYKRQDPTTGNETFPDRPGEAGCEEVPDVPVRLRILPVLPEF